MPRSVPARPKSSWLFVGGAFTLAAVVALCVTSALGYAEAARWVDHTLTVQRELDQWQTDLTDAERAVSGYAAAEHGALPRYREALQRSRTQARALALLVADNQMQMRNIAAAEHSADATLALLEARVVHVDQGDGATVLVASAEALALMAEFRELARNVRLEEAELMDDRREHADVRAWRMLVGAGLLAFVSLLSLVFAAQRESRHEQAVSRMAREARQRLRLLSDLAAALSATRTPQQVADVVVEHGLKAAGGDTCSLYILNAAETELELLGACGVGKEIIENYGK
ncbi:MAG: CHASE3 domain-containing protein [Polyangiaceae bacterium]